RPGAGHCLQREETTGWSLAPASAEDAMTRAAPDRCRTASCGVRRRRARVARSILLAYASGDRAQGNQALRLEERKVAVCDLQVGMYVSRLDRDWVGTPFPLQGLMVRSREDIDRLSRYSQFVHIDIERGLEPDGWSPPG